MVERRRAESPEGLRPIGLHLGAQALREHRDAMSPREPYIHHPEND